MCRRARAPPRAHFTPRHPVFPPRHRCRASARGTHRPQKQKSEQAMASALVDASPAVIAALEAKLVAPDPTLAQKYRVLFSLRNDKGEAAHRALETGAVERWVMAAVTAFAVAGRALLVQPKY